MLLSLKMPLPHRADLYINPHSSNSLIILYKTITHFYYCSLILYLIVADLNCNFKKWIYLNRVY